MGILKLYREIRPRNLWDTSDGRNGVIPSPGPHKEVDTQHYDSNGPDLSSDHPGQLMTVLSVSGKSAVLGPCY